jgi:phosphonate transport system permease protein
MASPRTEQPRIGGAIPQFSWKPALVVLVILSVTGWSAAGVGFDLVELVSSTGPIKKFLSGMFPPDLSASTLATTARGVLETFQMSFLGTLIGAVISFPLAAFATGEEETTGASRGERLLRAVPYHLSRFVLNVFHSVPDILWALVLVVALGLGPFPGTLALAVHSAGIPVCRPQVKTRRSWSTFVMA